MFDHIGFGVSDVSVSRAFYKEVLMTIGMTELAGDGQNYIGFGIDKPIFWIGKSQSTVAVHLAFIANSREEVDAFYTAAMQSGARDNGKPGFREEYSPGYYAAFVFDPEGNNIEAVYHDTTVVMDMMEEDL